MTQLDKIEKSVINAADYQAPTTQRVKNRFRLSGGHWLLLALAVLCVLFISFITVARSIEINTLTKDIHSNELVDVKADVSLSGLLKLPIGNRVLVLPGVQLLSAKAKGFEFLSYDIEVQSGRYQSFDIELIPLQGQLDISLSPPVFATVFLNGEKVAELPGLIGNVPAGKHDIRVDAPLYRAQTQQVFIQGRGLTQALSVTLEPAWADVSFSSVPSGAKVMIDGNLIGSTPLTSKLEEGLREVVIQADKYQANKQQLTIVAEQPLVLPTVTLIPALGVLRVMTEPSNAAIIVNGQYQGVSPLSLNLLPNIQQTVQVYKAGYQRQSKKVSLAPAEQKQSAFTLQQDVVAVRFSVSPKHAVLYVDGVKRGVGSQTLKLNTLPHQVSVRSAGYVSSQQEVVPTKNSKQIVSVTLLTKEQHFWKNIAQTYKTTAGQAMKLFKSPGVVNMGSSRREAGRRANEVAYTANLTKHFYVSINEVTNKQFRLFNANHTSGNYKRKSLNSGTHPVANVSWQQAALYCNWLSKKEKLTPFYKTESGFVSGNNVQISSVQDSGYRLLTEAEWAWLARNQSNSRTLMYPWGNNDAPNKNRIGNFADKNARDLIAFTLTGYDDGYAASSPIGKYPANHRGVYDMGGNVSEWVNDWYGANTHLATGKKGVLLDPLGPDIGEFHVVRGGSWAKGHLPQLRLAYRDYGAKGRHDIGFRIARYTGSPK